MLGRLVIQKETDELAALGHPTASDFLCRDLAGFQEVERLARLGLDDGSDSFGTPDEIDRGTVCLGQLKLLCSELMLETVTKGSWLCHPKNAGSVPTSRIRREVRNKKGEDSANGASTVRMATGRRWCRIGSG